MKTTTENGMRKYHKIQTVFKRDPLNKFKSLLDGDYSLPEFEYLKDNDWVFTEKVDGTNIRIKCAAYSEEKKAYGITFGGKTDNAQIPSMLIERLESRFHSNESREKIAEMFADGCCLYGEGYGAKIQKGGGNYRSDQDFVLFDVKVGEYWLQRKDVEDIAYKLGLDIVPIIGKGNIRQMIDICKTGFNSKWGNFMAEGIVARPLIELKSRMGYRIITKLKYKDFH